MDARGAESRASMRTAGTTMPTLRAQRRTRGEVIKQVELSDDQDDDGTGEISACEQAQRKLDGALNAAHTFARSDGLPIRELSHQRIFHLPNSALQSYGSSITLRCRVNL